MRKISAVVSALCAVLGSGAILLSGVHTSSGIEQWQPLNGRVESLLSEKTGETAGESAKDAAAADKKQKKEQGSKQDVKPGAKQDSVPSESAQANDSRNTADKAQSSGDEVAPGQAVNGSTHSAAELAANAASGPAGTPSQQPSAGGSADAGSGSQTDAGGQVKKVNVNTAGLSELTDLPGIGEAKAKAILEYRDQHGSFKSVTDLDKVKGIGPKMLEKMKPYIEL
ncbi:competence protein ComEA [Paenibacillus rhizosphaerae]|uniref:Competence protein ComEA n=1 Tax=Paenibacillus rhizosphaerae TaxID=297318 RepID=A0A839TNG9_9BACL|nr:helix-hairpin-helix domain-containing protein [Paenibacillus rhizosphaerae]MBB3127260.1 competence protein ComEA [Paenibacillus rhizosphaerae]